MSECKNYKKGKIPNQPLVNQIVLDLRELIGPTVEIDISRNKQDIIDICVAKYLDLVVMARLRTLKVPVNYNSFSKRRRLQSNYSPYSFFLLPFKNSSTKLFSNKYKVNYWSVLNDIEVNSISIKVQLCDNFPFALLFLGKFRNIVLEGAPPKSGTGGQGESDEVGGEEGVAGANYQVYNVIPYSGYQIENEENYYAFPVPAGTSPGLSGTPFEIFNLPEDQCKKSIAIIDANFSNLRGNSMPHGTAVYQIVANVINDGNGIHNEILLIDLNKSIDVEQVFFRRRSSWLRIFSSFKKERSSIKVYDYQNSFSLACKIVEAADKGVKLINLSLGCHTTTLQSYLQYAIEYACNKGAVFVTSAGNIQGKNDPPSNNDECPHWPSNYSGLNAKFNHRFIAVSATQVNDNGIEQADYANYGEKMVDISARGNYPGKTNNPDQEEIVGTSFAAANLTGHIMKHAMDLVEDINPGKVDILERVKPKIELQPLGNGINRTGIGLGNIKS